MKCGEFNLVGCWSRTNVYMAQNWSWSKAEETEEELFKEVSEAIISPDFLNPLRLMGTGEPVPLSMLTIEQLREVAEFTPTNEKKAVIITEEDKRIFKDWSKKLRKKARKTVPIQQEIWWNGFILALFWD